MSRLTATPARQARAAIDAMLGAIAARDPKAIGGRMPDDGFYL
jgi:NitT/TauT family transport system substrate-binding protein